MTETPEKQVLSAASISMELGKKYSSEEGKDRLRGAIKRVMTFAENYSDKFAPKDPVNALLSDIKLCCRKVAEALEDDRPARRFRSPHGEQRYYINLLQKLGSITDEASEQCINLARHDQNLRAALRIL
jgi:hypothetical protein